MTPIVIDTSVVVCWCMADEDHALADQSMELTLENGAVVPGIWRYEVRNALLTNERRGRIDAKHTRARLTDLREMRISADHDHDDRVILNLARTHGLSVYDAAYLETALRRSLPLASLDRRLCEAAAASGATLVQP
ncbi:type II toxin-antitoxin system VapC family toxin [Candidatus Palauibacter sp.]|uniref:type II toxin-antitoxin system VapC family toxin n=1 Tax=Candidatus Palauibacter sp. TaxID=3101350 RepID=UPI003B5C7BDC